MATAWVTVVVPRSPRPPSRAFRLPPCAALPTGLMTPVLADQPVVPASKPGLTGTDALPEHACGAASIR
jgi:hypothetical protein